MTVTVTCWDFPYLQDIFHSTTHWLHASGIFGKIKDEHMDAEFLIPLPKKRPNSGLEPIQLLMLFLLWVLGITIGTLTLLAELMIGVKTKE